MDGGARGRVSEERSEWDPAFADGLIGAVVLVGITRHLPSGPEAEQFYGTVETVDPTKGITLELMGSRAGDRFRFPPDLSVFSEADPGSYRLRASGETVDDPDYLAVWEIFPPAD